MGMHKGNDNIKRTIMRKLNRTFSKALRRLNANGEIKESTIEELVKAINVAVNTLRWPTEHNNMHDVINELAKQCANICATYILASWAEHSGMKVEWTRFPWISLKKLFEKNLMSNFRDNRMSEICENGGIEKKQIDSLVNEQVKDPFLRKCFDVKEDWLESRLFKAATRLMSLVEYKEKGIFSRRIFEEIMTDIIVYSNEFPFYKEIVGAFLKRDFSKTLKSFNEESAISKIAKSSSHEGGQVIRILKLISKTKGIVRWEKQFKAKNCSVLEHMAETAFFGWLGYLYENPGNEEKATWMFFVGAFHDFSEYFTGDMASPLKDAIEPLRGACELYENLKLSQEIFQKSPKFLAEKLMEITVLDNICKEDHDILKGADYFSAALECYRNFLKGSRHKYFFDVVEDYDKDWGDFPEVFHGEIKRIKHNMSKEHFFD